MNPTLKQGQPARGQNPNRMRLEGCPPVSTCPPGGIIFPPKEAISAAESTGLPETARMLRAMRREFSRFSPDPCDLCMSQGEEAIDAMKGRIRDVRMALANETPAVEARCDDTGLIRIRPGKPPEREGFSAYALAWNELCRKFGARSRLVEPHVLAGELAGAMETIEGALKDAELMLRPDSEFQSGII